MQKPLTSIITVLFTFVLTSLPAYCLSDSLKAASEQNTFSHQQFQYKNSLLAGIGFVAGDATLGRPAIVCSFGYAQQVNDRLEIESVLNLTNWTNFSSATIDPKLFRLIAQSAFNAVLDISARNSIQDLPNLHWAAGASFRWHNMILTADYADSTIPRLGSDIYSQGLTLGLHGKLDYGMVISPSAEVLIRGQFHIMPWIVAAFPREIPRPSAVGMSASISAFFRVGF